MVARGKIHLPAVKLNKTQRSETSTVHVVWLRGSLIVYQSDWKKLLIRYEGRSEWLVFEQCESCRRVDCSDVTRLHAAAAVISAAISLTWKSRQDAGVGTRFLRVLRRVFGLQDLVEVEEFSVPPVDEILTPSFSPHLNHKPLGEKRKHEAGWYSLSSKLSADFCKTYKVVDEAFLLLDVGDGGTDSDVVRQLIKVAA